jgi:transcriptional regulator with XRE-family HTH domain
MKSSTPLALFDKPKKVSSIDIQIGERLRFRRELLNITQEQLAKDLHISFQQLQKYERGINRISASRLFEASKLLDVPIGFFF